MVDSHRLCLGDVVCTKSNGGNVGGVLQGSDMIKGWLTIGWRLYQRRDIGGCKETSHEAQVVGWLYWGD